MAAIFDGTNSSTTNVMVSNSSEKLSFICSKEEGSQTVSYYFVKTVGAIDQIIQLPVSLTDVTIQMSRISSKGGWDTQSLCTANVMDLPEAEWRTLSIGSDCGIGASISACDVDTTTDGKGIKSIRLFPLVNGFYSGASEKIEKGTLIKIIGVPTK